MKRTAPPFHLRQAPLIYVVAQVRFSAVVAVEKYVGDIQEQLRHKGFPRFLRGQVHEITFQTEGTPKFSVVDRFEFQNKESSVGIVLQANSVAVHTSQYSKYEAFEENVKTALVAVDRALGISLSERIGLRYVNLIRLGDGEKWSDYLNQGLLGLEPGSVGVRSWVGRSEFIAPTEVGKLAVRCWQSEQPFPPDLLTTSLSYPTTMINKGEIVTTLDFDHFTEESQDFKVAGAMANLEQLHEKLDKVFIAAVTPKALSKWGREEG